MAEAMGWVAKITTVGLEMALPAMFGSWLDSRWGTRYFGLLGVSIGVPVGMVWGVPAGALRGAKHGMGTGWEKPFSTASVVVGLGEDK